MEQSLTLCRKRFVIMTRRKKYSNNSVNSNILSDQAVFSKRWFDEITIIIMAMKQVTIINQSYCAWSKLKNKRDRYNHRMTIDLIVSNEYCRSLCASFLNVKRKHGFQIARSTRFDSAVHFLRVVIIINIMIILYQ